MSLVGAKIHESCPVNGIIIKYFIAIGIFNAPLEIIIKAMTSFARRGVHICAAFRGFHTTYNLSAVIATISHADAMTAHVLTYIARVHSVGFSYTGSMMSVK